jgi:hypothetical protein
MTPSEQEALQKVAQRVVWFKTPTEAMENEAHFLAHLMCYGALSDIQEVRNLIGDERISLALDNAPSGIFTPRQWGFWNRRYGKNPIPPLLKRSARY